jgi:hypothetical protein
LISRDEFPTEQRRASVARILILRTPHQSQHRAIDQEPTMFYVPYAKSSIASLGSSLIALTLFAGVADAGRGGPSMSSGSMSSAPRVSASSSSERKVEPRAEKRVAAPAQKVATAPRSEKVDVKSKPEPKVKIESKSDPRVTTKTENLKPTTRVQHVAATKAPVIAKSAVSKPIVASQSKLVNGKTIAALGAAAATVAVATSHRDQHVVNAPVADKQHHVSQSSMDHFVAKNVVQHNATSITKADGPVKYQAAVDRATTLIKDPAKGYQVAKYGDDKKPNGSPQGDHGTIVINENNKTVYVPASTVSGPDRRTIVVNCNNCKVVVVGETGKNVVDERKIVVNGSGDKVVLQSDKSSGGAGQNGGTVTDNRQVVVNGNGDKIKLQGDNANGGDGRRGDTTGKNGGSGGYVDDNRQVTVNGNGAKVDLGKDTANGGNGGRGGEQGGNGGNGGRVDDDRTVVTHGNGTQVANAGADASGGRGGNGGVTGGNGGNGGETHGKGQIVDNGQGSTVTPGTYTQNGGDGGTGGPRN